MQVYQIAGRIGQGDIGPEPDRIDAIAYLSRKMVLNEVIQTAAGEDTQQQKPPAGDCAPEFFPPQWSGCLSPVGQFGDMTRP